jgi:hypothetical protein
MKNNRVKLYVIWPYLPSDHEGMPRLFSADFEERPNTYLCHKEDYPDPTTYRAFGWAKTVSKALVKSGDRLSYGGHPALTPEQAVARWRAHLRQQLDYMQTKVTRIKAALRGFKTPKEVKHGR